MKKLMAWQRVGLDPWRCGGLQVGWRDAGSAGTEPAGNPFAKVLRLVLPVLLFLAAVAGGQESGTVTGKMTGDVVIPYYNAPYSPVAVMNVTPKNWVPGGRVTGVSVYFKIDHPDTSVLEVNLRHKDERDIWVSHLLHNREAGTAGGIEKRVDGLTVWNNAKPEDTWQLEVKDHVTGQVGSIKTFEIWVDYVVFTPALRAVRLVDFEDRNGNGYARILTWAFDIEANWSGSCYVRLFMERADGTRIQLQESVPLSFSGDGLDTLLLTLDCEAWRLAHGVINLIAELRRYPSNNVVDTWSRVDAAAFDGVKVEMFAEDQSELLGLEPIVYDPASLLDTRVILRWEPAYYNHGQPGGIVYEVFTQAIGSPSGWRSHGTTAEHEMFLEGLLAGTTYSVKVVAVGLWEERLEKEVAGLFTTLPGEAVGCPGVPACLSELPVKVGQAVTFTVGVVICNWGHPVEYRFAYGDGSVSEWQVQLQGMHVYARAGVCAVRAQARCQVNGVESAWSAERVLNVLDDRLVAGSIIAFSESPLRLEGETRQVVVHVRNEGRDDRDLIVTASGLPEGWSVAPAVRQVRVVKDTVDTGSFCFDVTPPPGDASAMLIFRLYFDHVAPDAPAQLSELPLAVHQSPPRPNLTVEKLTVSPLSLSRNETLAFGATIRNIGTAGVVDVSGSKELTLAFFLGRTPGERWKTLIVFRSAGATGQGLLPGEPYTASTSGFRLPAGVAPGEYYITVIPDPDNVIIERFGQETDALSMAFTVLPDACTLNLFLPGQVELSAPEQTGFGWQLGTAAEERFSGNPVLLDDVPVGDGQLSGYVERTFWGVELWQRESVSLSYGQQQVDMVRAYPYVTAATLTDVTDGEPGIPVWASWQEPGAPPLLAAGRQLRLDMQIQNDRVGEPLQVWGRAAFDRDRSTEPGSWDVDLLMPAVLVPGDKGGAVVSVTLATDALQGGYDLAYELWCQPQQDEAQRSDACEWTGAELFTVLSDLPVSTFSGSLRWYGIDTPATIINPGKRYTVTTTHVSPFGRGSIKDTRLVLDHPESEDIVLTHLPGTPAYALLDDSRLLLHEAESSVMVDSVTGYEGWVVQWTFVLKGGWGNTTALRMKAAAGPSDGRMAAPIDYGVALNYAAYPLPVNKWTVIVHGKSAYEEEFSLIKANGEGPGFWSPDMTEFFAIQTQPKDVDDKDRRVVWMWEMANRLRLLSANPAEVMIHRLEDKIDFLLGTWSEDQQGYQQSYLAAGHHILLFDWDEPSNFMDANPLDDDKDAWYAYATGDALYALLRKYQAADKISTMIGYSRGGVVVSEAARRILSAGYPGFQLVFLDAEGWGEGIFAGPFFKGYPDDEFHGWDGTRADQYRQIDDNFWDLSMFCGAEPLDYGHDRLVERWPAGSRYCELFGIESAQKELKHSYFPHYFIEWCFIAPDARFSAQGIALETPEYYVDQSPDTPDRQEVSDVSESYVGKSLSDYEQDAPWGKEVYNGEFRDDSAAGWTYHGGTTPFYDYGFLPDHDVYMTIWGNAAIHNDDGELYHNWMVKPAGVRYLALSYMADSWLLDGAFTAGWESAYGRQEKLFNFHNMNFAAQILSMIFTPVLTPIVSTAFAPVLSMWDKIVVPVGDAEDECGRPFVKISEISSAGILHIDNVELIHSEPPEIERLEAVPPLPVRGEAVTLKAVGVYAPDDYAVDRVVFYMDGDKDGQLDYAKDIRIGASHMPGSWALTIPSAFFAAGGHRFFVVAVNEKGVVTPEAEAASVWVDVQMSDNRPPLVGALTATPSPVERGQEFVLTASAVADPDGEVAGVRFYCDDGDGFCDPNLDLLLGQATPEGGMAVLAIDSTGWPQAYFRYFALAYDNGAPVAVSAAASCVGRVEKHWQLAYAVQPPEAGWITPRPEAGLRLERTVVGAVAMAAADWHFARWEVNGEPAALPFVLLGDSTVTAVFSRQPTAPVIAELADQTIIAGRAYEGPVPLLLQGTNPVSWEWIEKPASMRLDSVMGVVTWDHPIARPLPYTLVLRARNEWGEDEVSWNLQVVAAVPRIQVYGNAHQVPSGAVLPSVDNHTDFGQVAARGVEQRVFVIRNDGDGELLLDGSPLVSLESGSGLFAITRMPSARVAPFGGSTWFSLAFEAMIPGEHVATIRVSSNAEPSGTYEFTVKATAQLARQSLTIAPGWSLVSLGLNPQTADLVSLFAEAGQGQRLCPFWKYDPVEKIFVRVDALAGGAGYLVFNQGDEIRLADISGSPVLAGQQQQQLQPGWNLLGPANGVLLQERDGPVEAWYWDCASRCYRAGDALQEGVGYWTHVDSRSPAPPANEDTNHTASMENSLSRLSALPLLP